jgi:flagellar FliJ protein
LRRFRFNLDPALRIRKSAEDLAKRELAETQRLLAREEAQLQELRQELERHQVYRTRLQRQAVDVSMLVDADRYTDSVIRSSIQQEERVEDALRALHTAREQLSSRRIDRESIERLRDRRLEEHRQEQLRQEQHQLDEAAVLRWSR